MALSKYTREADLPVPVEAAFAWHERPGALDRLIPPWESVRVVSRSDGIYNGARVELVHRLGPLRVRWIAEHSEYEKNRQFRDTQLAGPFAHWNHLHTFEPAGPQKCCMTDSIEYRLPAGPLGQALGGESVRSKIERMFTYRHETTRADLAAQARHREKGSMVVAVTGGGGLVGGDLMPFLSTGGHQVMRIRRGEAAGGLAWDPAAGSFDAEALDGIDAFVHLAGENIAGRRWSGQQKKRIRDSRVEGTRLIATRLASMKRPPQVLVCASAVGYYGDRGDEWVDESSTAGEGFLSEVAQAWEAACNPAAEAGIRVVNLRFGMILSPKEGALAKMLAPFRLGAGGVVGDGRQRWSWISIDDAIGAIHHAIMDSSMSGPVNAVAPQTVTNREFTKTLGRVLLRPTIAPLPAFAARAAFGEMANELLLTGTRVRPAKLIVSRYEFRQGELEIALRHLLGR